MEEFVNLPDGWYDLEGDGMSPDPDKRCSIYRVRDLDTDCYKYCVYVEKQKIITVITKDDATTPGRHDAYYNYERLKNAAASWGVPLASLIIDLNVKTDLWKDDLILEP